MIQQPEKRAIAPPLARRPGPASPAPQVAKAKSGGKNKKIANSLVALSSAAILSVYGLGYVRTDAAQALSNIDLPTIPIATAAPPAITAPSSPVAAYQSPLLPSPTAATSASGGGVQGVATATTAQPTAPIAAATNTPITTAKAPATSARTTTAKAPATATTVPPTATTAPLPRATSPAPTIPSSAAKAPAATKVPTVATKAPAAATTALYTDGTFTGTGTSRHGNISASVVVQGGKIVSAAITRCGTRYPCSDIASLPGEVVSRQSATVDFVSGATDSSTAYRGAIQNALVKAKVAA